MTTPKNPPRSIDWKTVAIGLIVVSMLCGLMLGCAGLVSLVYNNTTMAAKPLAAETEPPAAAQLPAPTQPNVSQCYPLSGQTYSSPQGEKYHAVWTCDGRLWQPQLPPGAERIFHTVAITIEEGLYAFDGVECQLFLDQARNSAGASNPVTVEYGNDLRFSVSTTDHGQAWALVQCKGNFSSGFQIRWLEGPLQ